MQVRGYISGERGARIECNEEGKEIVLKGSESPSFFMEKAGFWKRWTI